MRYWGEGLVMLSKVKTVEAEWFQLEEESCCSPCNKHEGNLEHRCAHVLGKSARCKASSTLLVAP